jgi:hypothetical protein
MVVQWARLVSEVVAKVVATGLMREWTRGCRGWHSVEDEEV